MFIAHMGKCTWLDRVELARIYSDDEYYPRNIQNNWISGTTPDAIRERYRGILNKLMLKHLIITPARMSHFFGQGAVESECLGKMVEASSSGERYRASLQSEVGGWYNNPDDDYYVKMGYSNNNGNLGKEDAIKFRDRGMKQLTGRSNYADYWNYRGWLREQKSYGEKGDYDWHWWDNSKKKAAEIDNPQIVGMEDYLTIDAGCWYWTAGRPTPINSKITESERVKDIEADVRGVSIAINGVNSNTGDPNGLEERKDNTKRIFNILMNGE